LGIIFYPAGINRVWARFNACELLLRAGRPSWRAKRTLTSKIRSLLRYSVTSKPHAMRRDAHRSNSAPPILRTVWSRMSSSAAGTLQNVQALEPKLAQHLQGVSEIVQPSREDFIAL
jgi:hypothetical protein